MSCLQELLAAGKGPGMSWRGTESGQVLLDLVRHGDVAEWTLWINSFGDTVYRALWGDKDTYSLAFAVAGRAHEFNQLQVCVSKQALRACKQETLSTAERIPLGACIHQPARLKADVCRSRRSGGGGGGGAVGWLAGQTERSFSAAPIDARLQATISL